MVAPTIRGTRRDRIIAAARAGCDLDPQVAHLVRVIKYDVPDRDGNGTGNSLAADDSLFPVSHLAWHCISSAVDQLDVFMCTLTARKSHPINEDGDPADTIRSPGARDPAWGGTRLESIAGEWRTAPGTALPPGSARSYRPGARTQTYLDSSTSFRERPTLPRSQPLDHREKAVFECNI